jgi:hypothetical protein
MPLDLNSLKFLSALLVIEVVLCLYIFFKLVLAVKNSKPIFYGLIKNNKVKIIFLLLSVFSLIYTAQRYENIWQEYESQIK